MTAPSQAPATVPIRVSAEVPRTCFVIMGFGTKTAFYEKQEQRRLDLNATYEAIIKPAVVAAGLSCIRADEILHSTVIDKPMYEQLLSADVVVADLSTSNANAIYELGVRHALRPRRTVVMAEEDFAFPFDISRISIMRYRHLGEDIGAKEAERKKKELQDKLEAILHRDEVDSPVFLFLPSLNKMHTANVPAFSIDLEGILASGHVAHLDKARRADVADAADAAAPEHRDSLATLMARFREAKAAVSVPGDWLKVAAELEAVRRLQPDDSFVVQQLALATYKSEQPDRLTALARARGILDALNPAVSIDAETVGLWGAIHKRLWEQGRAPDDLDEAIRAYGRGFLLRHDHYNGINYAFLLDVRASLGSGDEAVADRVLAARTRTDVLGVCDGLIAAGGPKLDYWVKASRAEALFGLGRRDEARAYLDEVAEGDPKPEAWMIETTRQQLAKLAVLLPDG